MTVILIRKRSAWEQYHQDREAYGTLEKASLRRLQESHDRHCENVEIIHKALKDLRITPWVLDGAETRFKASPKDLVLAVGGDGTFLSASHNLGSQTIIMGINSDPLFSKGRFCCLLPRVDQARRAIKKALTKPKTFQVMRMAVTIDGREVAKRVLNEALYSHTCPAAMTRVSHKGVRYACSGMWVGTGAGSTGAIRSAGGKILPLRSPLLQTVVREPCNHVVRRSISLLAKRFEFVSKTQDATLFLDGPFLRVPVNFDQVMRFSLSCETLAVVPPTK